MLLRSLGDAPHCDFMDLSTFFLQNVTPLFQRAAPRVKPHCTRDERPVFHGFSCAAV